MTNTGTISIKIEEAPDEHATVIDSHGTTKAPVTKEKLRSIMEAASALTSLGDEDDEAEEDCSVVASQYEKLKDNGDGIPEKRYIPEHKKPDGALTFPEKLMSMMKMAETENPETFCIAWLPDGKSFVIRNPMEFTRTVLPKYFKATKFSSYTRKLYRWGFRQVNRGIGPDDPIIFGNEYFQRDNAKLMVKMRSTTAAGTRKAQNLEQDQHEIDTFRKTNKRPHDGEIISLDEQRKRIMLEHLLQQQHFGGIPGITDHGNFIHSQASLPHFNLSALRHPTPLNQQMGFKHFNPPSLDHNPLGLYIATQPQSQLRLMQPHNQYSAASTAEIVKAAINALRYAS